MTNFYYTANYAFKGKINLQHVGLVEITSESYSFHAQDNPTAMLRAKQRFIELKSLYSNVRLESLIIIHKATNSTERI